MILGDNAAAMQTFVAHSTARESIAKAIAQRWRHLTHASGARSPRILDLGTGDGALLAKVLARLETTCSVDVVEPDEQLAPLAVQHLRDRGHAANRVPNFPEGAHVDAYLAAHVLFYLPDIPAWFAAAAAKLAPTGVLSCVLRAPTCDCFTLRQLVRQHLGLELRVTPQQLHQLAADHNMKTDTITVSSALTSRVTDPRLAAHPNESAAPNLARLICWLAGLPGDQPIPDALRASLNEFLEQRFIRGTLILSQSDLLITATHPQRGLQAPSANPSHLRMARP